MKILRIGSSRYSQFVMELTVKVLKPKTSFTFNRLSLLDFDTNKWGMCGPLPSPKDLLSNKKVQDFQISRTIQVVLFSSITSVQVPKFVRYLKKLPNYF